MTIASISLDSKLDPKFIFATTNQGKIKRLRRLLGTNGPNFLTLSDFPQINTEPEENGNNELENAEIKARYYSNLINSPLPILCQDNGVYLPYIPEEYSPGKDVKATIVRHMGVDNQANYFKYWNDLALKYPNTVIYINWSFCIVDNHCINRFESEIKCSLVSRNENEIHVVDGESLSPYLNINIKGINVTFDALSESDMTYMAEETSVKRIINYLKDL